LFKWNEHDIGWRKVIKLFPHPPIICNVSSGAKRDKHGKASTTRWFCFYKPEKRSENYAEMQDK